MRARLAGFFVERASGRNLLLVFGAAIAAFSLFGLVLVPAFQAVSSGLYPIDMSFPTTPDVIYRELPQYTAASRRVYAWFFALDLVWPPLLAALFALSWCWLAARTRHPLPGRMIASGVLLLPFAEALLDWLENLGFIALINAYPSRLMGLALATGTIKHTKLVLYALCWMVTLLFIGLALFRPGRPSGANATPLTP